MYTVQYIYTYMSKRTFYILDHNIIFIRTHTEFLSSFFYCLMHASMPLLVYLYIKAYQAYPPQPYHMTDRNWFYSSAVFISFFLPPDSIGILENHDSFDTPACVYAIFNGQQITTQTTNRKDAWALSK